MVSADDTQTPGSPGSSNAPASAAGRGERADATDDDGWASAAHEAGVPGVQAVTDDEVWTSDAARVDRPPTPPPVSAPVSSGDHTGEKVATDEDWTASEDGAADAHTGEKVATDEDWTAREDAAAGAHTGEEAGEVSGVVFDEPSGEVFRDDAADGEVSADSAPVSAADDAAGWYDDDDSPPDYSTGAARVYPSGVAPAGYSSGVPVDGGTGTPAGDDSHAAPAHAAEPGAGAETAPADGGTGTPAGDDSHASPAHTAEPSAGAEMATAYAAEPGAASAYAAEPGAASVYVAPSAAVAPAPTPTPAPPSASPASASPASPSPSTSSGHGSHGFDELRAAVGVPARAAEPSRSSGAGASSAGASASASGAGSSAARDDDDPSQRRGARPPGSRRRRMILVALLLVIGLIATLIVLGQLNESRYVLVCGETAIAAEKGRAFPPWGTSRLEGAAWKPIAIPPQASCTPLETDDLAVVETAYRDKLTEVAEHRILATKNGATGAPDDLSAAEAEIQQALLLSRANEDARARLTRLLADVKFLRTRATVTGLAGSFADAAKEFRAARDDKPRHTTDADSWAKFAESLAQELLLGPPALRPEPPPEPAARPPRERPPADAGEPPVRDSDAPPGQLLPPEASANDAGADAGPDAGDAGQATPEPPRQPAVPRGVLL